MYIGEKVRLRSYDERDVKRALTLFSNPELMDLISTVRPFPFTYNDELSFIRSQTSKNENAYAFAIETLDDGKYIGGCGVNHFDARNRCATVGIAVADPEYWGGGYGTDAMRVLLRFLFLQRNVHRVELQVYAYNQRAVRSYEKCGFVHEGARRRCAFSDGRFYDEYSMGILQEEWLATEGGAGK